MNSLIQSIKHFAGRVHKEIILSEKAFHFRFVYFLHYPNFKDSKLTVARQQSSNIAHSIGSHV
jgi:hypothetical protein